MYVQVKNKDGSTKKRRHDLKLSDPTISRNRSKRKIGTTSAGKESSHRTVFVSGGTRDIDAVHAVREAFSRHNVEVVGPQDVKAGQDWQKTVNDMIARADAAVFVMSGRPNLWLNEEIKAAVKEGVRHIVPLIVGSSVEVPDILHDIEAVHVDSQSAVADMADTLLNRSLGKI